MYFPIYECGVGIFRFHLECKAWWLNEKKVFWSHQVNCLHSVIKFLVNAVLVSCMRYIYANFLPLILKSILSIRVIWEHWLFMNPESVVQGYVFMCEHALVCVCVSECVYICVQFKFNSIMKKLQNFWKL